MARLSKVPDPNGNIKAGVSVALEKGGYSVHFDYDNRTLVTTEYDNIDAVTKKFKDHVVPNAYNTYDSMNRQLIVNGGSE